MRRLPLSLIVLVASAASAFAQSTQPTTNPEAAAARIRLERDAASLPTQRFDSIEQVFELKRDGNQLSLAVSPSNKIEEETRIFVPGLAGVLRFAPRGSGFPRPPAAGEQMPVSFQFSQIEVFDNGAESITSVSQAAGRIIIARDAGPETAIVSVQLLQTPASGEPNPNEPPVKLYIHKNSKELLRAGAMSFAQLIAEHPREVEEYLRPIFRDVHAEAAVFAPDPRTAWQVLGEDFVPDAATVSRVNAIVDRLDNEDFQTRQQAAADLQEIGQPAALVLMRADRSKMSPEKQSNVDTFLAAYQPYAPEEARRLRDDRAFLIDCLNVDDAALRTLAWKRLQQVANPAVQFDPNADAGTRAEAISKLRESLSK